MLRRTRSRRGPSGSRRERRSSGAAMNRLRNRLIAAFLASTLLPLADSLDHHVPSRPHLGYATTGELDRLSRTLEAVSGSSINASARRSNRTRSRDARARRRMRSPIARDGPRRSARSESGEPERFGVSGPAGFTWISCADDGDGRRDLQPRPRRHPDGRPVGPFFDRAAARRVVRGATQARLHHRAPPAPRCGMGDLARATGRHRPPDQPARSTTHHDSTISRGDWSLRVETAATRAFRRVTKGPRVDAFQPHGGSTATERERLVHLTRMASWQSLARKTAHELKNSLTPIRLTVEENPGAQPRGERAFVDQAVQIVVSEIESLERRVRAFSELSSEPPVTRSGSTSTRSSPSACRSSAPCIPTPSGTCSSIPNARACTRPPIS